MNTKTCKPKHQWFTPGEIKEHHAKQAPQRKSMSELIAKMLEDNPELRLGKIISIAIGDSSFFNISDEMLESKLIEFLNRE